MSTFVQERLRQLHEQEDSRSSDRDWLRHADKVFSAKARSLWDQVASVSDERIGEWNKGLGRPNHPRRVELQSIPSERLLARCSTFPSVTVELWLDRDDQSLRYEVRRKLDQGSVPTSHTGRMPIKLLEADGELHVDDGCAWVPDISTALELIISPLFSAY